MHAARRRDLGLLLCRGTGADRRGLDRHALPRRHDLGCPQLAEMHDPMPVIWRRTSGTAGPMARRLRRSRYVVPDRTN